MLWRPWSSVPRDDEGIDILATDARIEGGFAQVVYYDPDTEWPGYPWHVKDGSGKSFAYADGFFTHWMPIPEVEPMKDDR